MTNNLVNKYMKPTLKESAPSLVILITTWVVAIYFFSIFPERVVTHWNFKGIADGYSGKILGAFLIPAISTFMLLLFWGLPFIDPKKRNYEQFKKIYNLFINIFLIFFLLLLIITGLINIGINLPMNIFIPALLGILFIAMGSLMGKVKQNWFIGFRFPWTLSSESVWNKTNRFGGWAMIYCGGLILISPLFPETTGILLFICGIIIMVFGTMLYSYLLFRKEEKVLKK